MSGLYIILFIVIFFILILSIKMFSSSSSSSKTPTDPTIDAALAAGKVAGSSAAAAFVPNYVPPNPVEETSFLTDLINMAKGLPEQIITQVAFDKFVASLVPARLQTWKGLFGNNKPLTDKMKINRSKTLVHRLSKQMIDSLSDVYSAAKLAIGQVTTQTAKTVATDANTDIINNSVRKQATRAEVRINEATTEIEAGPIGAALATLQVAGMALDFANIDNLEDWQNYTTSAMDAQKRADDNKFATTANDNQVTLPLITGPLDQIDSNIFSSMMESSEINFIAGITAPSNPGDAAIINSIKLSIVNNFVKSTGSSQSSVTLRDAFNASTMSTLTDEQQQQISNIAYNSLCIKAKGTLVNNTYCSFSTQNSCNLTDQEFTAYIAGDPKSRSQFSEWKSKDYINQQYKITIDQANACIVGSSTMRTICQDGHKDITGKMQHNSYDYQSGRCFNTKPFCDSFGVQWDGTNLTCTANATLKIFDLVFGSTITQGTAMVINTAIDGTVHALDHIGPAGRFLGNFININVTLLESVTCAFCTIASNGISIIIDVFTGNFNDIKNKLNNTVQQINKTIDAIGGFFMAIIQDFFDLF